MHARHAGMIVWILCLARPTAAGDQIAAGAAGPAADRPNLLVFLADDLGARDLGCTGSTFYRTPAIDRLASEGMRFTRGYASCPVCSPTRAALVTGRHPARVKITNFIAGDRRGALLPAAYLHALPDGEVTVAELLEARGYATGIFGKWHLGPPADIRLHGYGAQGSTAVSPGHGPADDPMHARAIADQAASFIRARRDRPWLCYVPMHSVHVPLAARQELIDEEAARAAALAPEGPREIDEGDRQARAVQDLPVYAAMIREMDSAVATILAAVDEAGARSDTLVIFTSDNGGLATAEGSPTSNLPLRAGKGYLYEGGIRVPLIVRWPGVVRPGTTTDVPATTLDIAATLLDVSGAKVPSGTVLDGASLRPVLDGTADLPPRDLLWHYPHYSNQGGRPGGAIVAGDGPRPGAEKLIEHFEDGRIELFDLDADPGERRNLAPERRQRVATLRDRLAAWRGSVAAAMPEPNPHPVDPFGPDALPPRGP
jgi:arylsulfatase A-like enzyme